MQRRGSSACVTCLCLLQTAEPLLTGTASSVHLLSILTVQGRSEWLSKVTTAWQAGRISNLDYILFCNLAAGRSFNDLTQ